MRVAAPVVLGLFCTTCQPAQPCDDIAGSCLLLHVEGSGQFDNLRSTALGSTGNTLKSGDIAMAETLPVSLRLAAPPGVSSTTISTLRIEGLVAGQVTATGTTPSGFSWPDGAHIEATVTLAPGGPVPPGPLLTWREETAPVGVVSQLYDVWVSPAGEPVLAVGENGTALARSGGMWKVETTNSTALLGGVYGVASGTGWAAGQIGPTVLRRDGTTGAWSMDQTSIPTTGKGFWCLTTGQNNGEVWAGDNDGKVWHRTGSLTANGTWVAEQALPAGNGVYGIAYGDGAVFAVGDAGNVAVRKDSAAGTPWTQAKISGNFSSTDWFNAVWVFDRNTAVAVGTSGSLVSYQGGAWAQTVQKIDSSNSEMAGVWGLTPSRVWVSSRNGFILRVDGTMTYKLYAKQGVSLNAVYGLSDTNIYAVGGATGQPSLIVHGTP